MLSRRSVACAGVLAGAGLWNGPALARDLSFEELLTKAKADPLLLEAGRGQREGREIEETKGVAPRYTPSPVVLSEAAIDMVQAFEITSPAVYQKKYLRPVWPQGASGVTIGVGYDLGYMKPEWVEDDWKGLLDQDRLNLLKTVCGKKGAAAKAALASVKTVEVPWAAADKQFRTTGFPRYAAQLFNQRPPQLLPNAKALSSDSFGAILSLAYNRGPSFRLAGPRYAEMRAIRLHMVNEDYDLIPGEIRRMKRLWAGDPKMKGLLARRELEAVLFERGRKVS